MGHHGGSARHHHNNESFEVEFDSAEFDEQHITEGMRPEYDHDFMPKSNDIKEISLYEEPPGPLPKIVPYVSFFWE